MAKKAKKKDPAAVSLGRRGGSKKTSKPKGLAALGPKEREVIRAKALAARRSKKNNPPENTA